MNPLVLVEVEKYELGAATIGFQGDRGVSSIGTGNLWMYKRHMR